MIQKPEEEAAQESRQHNPWPGWSAAAAFPKVKLPDDIKNPERWRYVPEGRIKPGNIIDRFLVSSFAVPIVYFEQDVGAGGGAGIFDIDFRQSRRKEFMGAFATYTTEGQQRFAMAWQRWLNHRELEGGGIAYEERTFLRARAGYSRTLTRRFYGLGADTRENGETSYTDEATVAAVAFQSSVPRLWDDLIIRITAEGQYHNLSSGRVSGAPSTEEIYPELFEQGDNYGMLWLRGVVRYDTRDSQHNPYGGGFLEVSLDASPWQDNSEAALIASAEANYNIEVPGLFHSGGDENEENPPTDVLAFDAKLASTHGELPYWALPSLGGSHSLRGYIRNRFTGKAAWHASAEYRFWIVPRGFAITDYIRVERLGMALFYDLGTVAEDMSDLWSAEIKHSYGVGFRMTFERGALFRADLGFSEEGPNFSLGFGLSF